MTENTAALPAAERPGTPALPQDLIDVDALLEAYHTGHPDVTDPAQKVVFGTSGHRGSAFTTSFNDDHIAAITQAVVEYRAHHGITGPVLVGKDTHALSGPAQDTAVEVLLGNDVEVLVDSRGGYTPTPAVSHAILHLNAGRELSPSGFAVDGDNAGLVDGLVITPSHNPPADGGFKYNPPHGGPADTEATTWIADRANELLAAGLAGVHRVASADVAGHAKLGGFDFLDRYVSDLPQVIDVEAIREAGVRIGADPMGGASVAYWGEIADRHGLDLTVVNPEVDPRFGFMTLDWDGKIRMDCSSPNAMASLIERMTPDADGQAPFDVATGNDADADRHGIVTPDAGLMNPNHFLATAIAYLFAHRPQWSGDAAIGKTIVSSSIIDRVAKKLGRKLAETPVGFKWFVDGLGSGGFGFAGEESAGASFLKRDGSAWTTDKDGVILGLLAAEIIARTGRDPSELFNELTAELGVPYYERIDVAATPKQKSALKALGPEQLNMTELAGDPVRAVRTRAPGNDQPFGGIKVESDAGWFAARPSGTEDVYKIYAESFRGPDHLNKIQGDAQAAIAKVF